MLDIRSENIKVETAVLVLNWQGEKLIRDCLDALRDQDYQDFLTVVADNASTDASVEIIRSDYPDVLLYDFKETTASRAATTKPWNSSSSAIPISSTSSF